MVRKVLLICGILSPVLYAVSDAVAGMQWEGYSFRDQTISELGAIDAPTRPLFSVLLLLVYGLMAAFGVGIRKEAGGNRRLRIVGGLIVALGVMALTVGHFAPMRLRGTEQGLVGALHLVEGAVAMLIIFTAMGIAAGAFGTRFRLYTIGTIVLALGFGAWAASEATLINQGLATPWVGVKERIFWYGYQSWFIVLALTLLRGQGKQRVSGSRSPFKTLRGEAAYLAAYEDAMKFWPVPFEEMEIPSQFGTTHVVVSGPREAPPLVLLHGAMATLTMWAPNVLDFIKDFRVYAFDTMGHPGKSVPDKPVKDVADYVAWITTTLDKLHLDRVALLGMSHGGWLALNFAVAAPERVEKLALLSPGGIYPWSKQWTFRTILMAMFPTRFTVNSFLRWTGLAHRHDGMDPSPVLELIYLGLKHFRIPQETLRIKTTVLSDEELQRLNVPVLLLIGEDEVMHDASKAFARARRLVSSLQGGLVPNCSHDMCFSQHQLVDARVLDFLRKTRIDQDTTHQRSA